MKDKFICECCGKILTKEQMKIEKRINTDITPCYCNLIIEIDKLNKEIKKLKVQSKNISERNKKICRE